ncbi:MAG: hypothetical protein LBU25_07565 [Treponema sp.]|jgi:hypothetical protein|nr:hypothetical protein [Treponema sp.]
MAIQTLFTYTVTDIDFQDTKLYHIDRDDEDPDVLGGIQDPVDKNTDPEPEVPSQDVVVHSYSGSGRNSLRFLVGKITTLPSKWGQTSETCVYTELDDSWEVVGDFSDITLVERGSNTPAATDPHGFAQIEDMLYIVDYDSTKIWLLGNEELAGAGGSTLTLANAPIDIPIGTVLPRLPPSSPTEAYQYHGNGIVALQDENKDWYLFALFIVSNNVPTPNAPPEPYLDSQLVRIKVSGTTGGAMDVVPVGPNAVDMDVVNDAQGKPMAILISAIGGSQKADATSDVNSRISKVSGLFLPTLTPTTLLTGDDIGDFRGLAMYKDGNDNEKVCILTGYFSEHYTGFNWALYWIDAGNLLAMPEETPISAVIEEGPLHPIGSETSDPGYYWSIMAGGGRLVFIKGSAMVIMDADNPEPAFGGNNVTFGKGSGAGEIGNINANSIDFTEATLERIALEQRTLKLIRHRHHHRHHHLHHLAQQGPAGCSGRPKRRGRSLKEPP